jgi:starch-binding outer membrane protein, SusD/RagB family
MNPNYSRIDSTMKNKILKLAVLFVAALPLVSCDTDDLLTAETGILVDAGSLESPSSAALLLNGALSDFDCALGAHIVASGILADELADAQLGAAGWPLDRRDLTPGDAYGLNGCANNQTPGAYNGLAIARWSTDNILKKLQEWTDAQVPNRIQMIATAAAMNGFTYIYLATDFCTAAVDLGPELQPNELLTIAEQRFTTAMDAATQANSPALLNLARLGRARARLYLGNKTGAAADARLIPADFVYNATASDINNRRSNRIYAVNGQSLFYTIEPSARALTLASGAPDPRVRVASTGARAADGTIAFTQTKYANLNANMPIARWAEAQLIIAEAEGGAAAVTALNAVRAKSGVPALNAAETANLQNTIIEDRRRELFLEGFRLHDMNRFSVPFNPAPGTAFPIKGGTYGTTRCMPLPDVERNNNPSLQK